MQLRHVLLALTPFALVALLHHVYYTTVSLTVGGAVSRAKLQHTLRSGRLAEEQRLGASQPMGSSSIHVRAASPSPAVALAAADAAAAGGQPLTERSGMFVYNRLLRSAPVSAGSSGPSRFSPENGFKDYDDYAARYPPPTLSERRLLDGSPNYLPVPDAESDDPSDLRWRKEIVPGAPCPKGRRPFHILLTAQASEYQEWQSKIMHYHYRKIVAANPCTEMTGFTRILASPNGKPDGLMSTMPTITISQADHSTTRGFQVINRPWTINAMLKDDAWRLKVPEDYVYIAETDHILLRDLPNRATPQLNVAFFFPYMSPVPEQQARVVKRYYSGNHLDVQPVGPSPAIMHISSLKKLTPMWLDLSVKLKADHEADATFGWVLEMWGYSLACANLGIKNFVWQQLQIEPSSTWHQNVSAEDPYIYHYTFGVEYTMDGIPVVGTVGEWSLDKRHYFGGYPPANLDPPPECARECAWVWWRAFSEAIEQLGDQWNGKQLGGTTAYRPQERNSPEETPLGRALVRRGPWSLGESTKAAITFFIRGRVSSPWGRGTWSAHDDVVTLSLCRTLELKFDSIDDPKSFTFMRPGVIGLLLGEGQEGRGELTPEYFRVYAKGWSDPSDAEHPAVRQVLGTGPWAWSGITAMAFLDRGVLVSPWGLGRYRPMANSTDTLILSFVGADHRVVLHPCNKFTSTRLSDGQVVEGWVQLGERARGCTGI